MKRLGVLCLAGGLACSVAMGQPVFLPESGRAETVAAATPRNPRERPLPRRQQTSPTTASYTCKTYNFDGVPDHTTIPDFDGLHSTGWVAGISNQSGGTAQFVKPAPGYTVAVFLGGGTDTINFSPAVQSVQYTYATAYPTTLTAYDGNNQIVATENILGNWDGNPAGYEVWTQIPALTAQGNVISSIKIQSQATLSNFLGIYDLEVCGSLAIYSVEMTQVIQQFQTLPDLKTSLDATNEPPVPIIAGKPGVMRLYTNQPKDVRAVNFKLSVSGLPTQTKQSILLPKCPPDKQRFDSSGYCSSTDFYFTPPSGSWTATLDLTDPYTGTLIEEEVLPFKSRTTKRLWLHPVGVCDTETSSGWTCGKAVNAYRNRKLLVKLAPSDTVSFEVSDDLVYKRLDSVQGPYTGDETHDGVWWDKVVDQISDLYGFWAQESDISNSRYTTYFGMIRETAAPQSNLGLAILSGHAGAAAEHGTVAGRDVSDMLVAHETGHTLSLKHTNTQAPMPTASALNCWGFAKDSGTDWPVGWNNQIQSNNGPEVGFDVANQQALNPLANFELMGYCYPSWITPFHYKAMIPALGGGAVTTPSIAPGAPEPKARSPKSRTVVTQPFWLVSGSIPGSGPPTFDPLFQQVLPGDTSGGSGAYTLEVQNNAGTVLFDQHFDVPLVEDRLNSDAVSSGRFSTTVPVEAGAARIVLKDSTGAILGTVALAGVAPAVTITNPTAAFTGSGSIAWTIDDPDSASFDSIVFYSHDNGATWANIGEVPNSGTSLTADFGTMAGTNGQTGLIKVLVSDGVNTGQATSAKFSIPKKLPSLVQIDAPGPNFAQSAADPVLFEGVGYDTDDGSLTGTALQWSSNVQGPLGSGEILSVNLNPGVHTITLTATDSDGNSIHTSETVTIGSQPPSLDVSLNTMTAPPASASTCVEATVNASAGTNGAPLSAVQYSVDGGNTLTSIPIDQLPYSFYVPGTGLISLVVQAIDTSGQHFAESGSYFNLYPCASLTVPNLAGMTLGDAANSIANANLVPGVATSGASNSVPAGSVMGQSPAAGTAIGPGSAVTVDVVVSNGALVGVPNVIGLTQAAATTSLTDAGMVVGAITHSGSGTVPFGAVISETPGAGTMLGPGGTVSLVISSGPTLTITSPAALPVGAVGSTYPPTTMVATGGSGNYTWSAAGLPGGLSITGTTDGIAITGAITGTPATNTGSPFTVTVTVTDSNSVTASQMFTLTVKPALTISGPPSLPGGTVGLAYAATTFSASGGSGGYTYLATGLPPGLKIAPATGVVSGTPSFTSGSPYNVQVSVQDSNYYLASSGVYAVTVQPSQNLCAVTGDGTPGITDIQYELNEALGANAPLNDLNGDGAVNVVDLQILVNAVLTNVCLSAVQG